MLKKILKSIAFACGILTVFLFAALLIELFRKAQGINIIGGAGLPTLRMLLDSHLRSTLGVAFQTCFAASVICGILSLVLPKSKEKTRTRE